MESNQNDLDAQIQYRTYYLASRHDEMRSFLLAFHHTYRRVLYSVLIVRVLIVAALTYAAYLVVRPQTPLPLIIFPVMFLVGDLALFRNAMVRARDARRVSDSFVPPGAYEYYGHQDD